MASDDAVWEFHREIPSDTAIGSALVSELLDAMISRAWPEVEQFRTRLAYEEAIVNAIRHGNQCDLQKTVTVEMSCDAKRVTIQITDQGQGFDPSAVPDPRRDDLLDVPGGRGVLLIHEIMSEVQYNARGNRVTMVKVKGDAPPETDDD